MNGCSPATLCSPCEGDCDSDSDCSEGLECFHRLGSESVPGCAPGGLGDVPGADYCYDPGSVVPVGSESPTAGPTVGSTEVGTESPTPSASDGTDSPTPSATPSTPSPAGELPYLTSPCGACAGDCDADSDCSAGDGGGDGEGGGVELGCFKRADGETSRVPGCTPGGAGDVPGADYCYDVSLSGMPTGEPVTYSPTTEAPQVGAATEPPTAPGTTSSPTPAGAYFIRSQARGVPPRSSSSSSSRSLLEGYADYNRGEVSVTWGSSADPEQGRALQGSPPSQIEWCISGALSPDYYQLLLEECTPDSLATGGGEGAIVSRMRQEDQLWRMDDRGHVQSVFDPDRCMTIPFDSVPSDADEDGVDEVPVEVGPCDDGAALNQFYYEGDDGGASGAPDMLKLRGYKTLCVTFLGGDVASRGAPVIVSPCGDAAKFGWDFVLEGDLGRPPTPSPTTVDAVLPSLRYLGCDACAPESPCQACAGDCDDDADCADGTVCFQRERDDGSPVPGCGSGGPGDIPGADYCYDPSYAGGGSPPPSPASQPLRWLGAEGCTADRPCSSCAGDCDEDDDCEGSLGCYKRLVGQTSETNPVPGCVGGGPGDVPGGDYCYDPNFGRGSTGGGPPSSRPGASGGRPVPPTFGMPQPPPSAPSLSRPNGGAPSAPSRPASPSAQETTPYPARDAPAQGSPSSNAGIESSGSDVPTPASISNDDEEEPSSPMLGPGNQGSALVPSPSMTASTSSQAMSADEIFVLDGAAGPGAPLTKPARFSGKSSKASGTQQQQQVTVAIERTREHAHASTRWEREHPGGTKQQEEAEGERTKEHGGTTRWEREHPGEMGE